MAPGVYGSGVTLGVYGSGVTLGVYDSGVAWAVDWPMRFMTRVKALVV